MTPALALMSDPFEPFAAVVVADRARVDIDALTVGRFFAKVMADGEHHVWTGGTSNGTPVVSFQLNTVRAANLAWVIARREDIPSRQMAEPTCGVDRCLRPEHLRLRSRAVQPRPRPQAIQELAPPELARLGEAQWGVRAPRVERRTAPAPTVSAPRHRMSALQIVALITAHQIAVVPFKSGSVKAFTPTGVVVHGDDLADAIEKVMRALEAA